MEFIFTTIAGIKYAIVAAREEKNSMKYFDYEYRVRYGDTDKLGISYYGNYFSWFEAARTEYFRAIGILYTECEKRGYFLPVIEAQAKYFAPSTFDDLLIVRTSVSELKKSSMRFEYQILNKAGQKLLTTGYTIHVFVDHSMRPVKMPKEINQAVECHSLLPV